MKRFTLGCFILLFAATALAQHPLRPWLDSPCANGQCGKAAIATTPIPAIPPAPAAIKADPTPDQINQIQSDVANLVTATNNDIAAQAAVATAAAAVTAAQTQLAANNTAAAATSAAVTAAETQLQADVAGLTAAQLAKLNLTPAQRSLLSKAAAKRAAAAAAPQPVYYYPARRRWFSWRR